MGWVGVGARAWEERRQRRHTEGLWLWLLPRHATAVAPQAAPPRYLKPQQHPPAIPKLLLRDLSPPNPHPTQRRPSTPTAAAPTYRPPPTQPPTPAPQPRPSTPAAAAPTCHPPAPPGAGAPQAAGPGARGGHPPPLAAAARYRTAPAAQPLLSWRGSRQLPPAGRWPPRPAWLSVGPQPAPWPAPRAAGEWGEGEGGKGARGWWVGRGRGRRAGGREGEARM